MQLASSATIKGIDISSINNDAGTFNWTSIKNDGVKFVIARAYGSTHGGTGDTYFVSNVNGARGVGIPIGAYYYAVPTLPYNPQEAKDQAQQFIDKMKTAFNTAAGDWGDIIPMLDFEDSTAWGGDTLAMDVSDLLDWADTFRNYFQQNTGVVLGIYTGYDYVYNQRSNFNYNKAGTKGNILSNMPLWVSGYDYKGQTTMPDFAGWTSYVAWQYTDQGAVAGTTGVIDMNRTDVIPTIRTWTAPPPDVPYATITNVSQYKISNRTGNDRAVVTFNFTVDTTEVTVNVTGVSNDTGIVAHTDSRHVVDVKKLTIGDIKSLTSKQVRVFEAGTSISAIIDSTEMYSENDNRVNIYGKSVSGIWTPYNQT